MSELHAMLKAKTIKSSNGNVINLYDRMVQIKEKATIWLSKLEKNGYEHSERLEEYLDEITKKPRLKGKLFPEEAFILLCAVYMHDLGYWLDGKCVAKGHPERSREMILENPGEYLLDDFPCMSIDNPPRVAEAIGWVCKGHSEERYFSLNEVPYDFADKALSNDTLNLRKLSALLRIADEADDPYIRLVGESYHPIRAKTPLVQIGDETIAWHWKYASGTTSDTFLQHIREKQEILVSSIDYLAEKEFGYWYLVLYPQVEGSSTYMPEEPVETFVGREEDLNKLHFIVQKRRQGAVSGVVGIGGIGKTELAKMYARRYRNEYPGGVFWASLKGSDWKSQAMKILKHLRPGVEPTGLPDEAKAKEVIKKVLGRKGALLIIDNVTKADQIIQPGCYLLITSREKDVFGIIPHEAIHILPGLSIDEGKDLLKKILGEERVQNDLLGAERLIKILGGMPLAVEIAAKHLADAPGVSFPEYIRWVDRKIEKLKLDDIFEKDVVASFEISLEQLHNERGGDKLIDLFEAVSVCAPSGFTSKTLAAAAGLNDLDEMTAGQYMGKLHNRSLLEYNEKTFSFSVHPLLFQIAERRLRENKSRHKSFMRNHCEYFLTYAEVNNTDIGMLIVEMYGLSCAMIQATYLDQSGRMLQRFIENISKTYWDLISKGAYGEALVYFRDCKSHRQYNSTQTDYRVIRASDIRKRCIQGNVSIMAVRTDRSSL